MSATPVPDPNLADIAAKVEAGTRLDHDDGVRLYASRDIFTIGRLANIVRERLHGRVAYYNINRHINYTNYCILTCRFCAFRRPVQPVGAACSRDPAAPTTSAPPPPPPLNKGGPGGVEGEDAPGSGAYTLTVDEIVQRAREAHERGATEVHIVGGLHPKLPFDYYVDICRGIRAACPKMHIKAFTAVEIIHFTRIAKPRLTIREVLEQLRAAGLDSLPGGGAEIFDDRVHNEAFRNKVGEHGWFDVHRIAHELGIFTNATMLYGHVETAADRITHLLKLRDHQDASLRARPAHFNCLVPLSFIPDGSDLAHLPGPTGLDDLKTLAIARLMLDNVSHIKAFWPMLSPKLAQLSLNWGVDDLDGTVVYYDITKREGRGTTHQELTVDQIKRLIQEAGRIPIERDTLYNPVQK